MRGALRKMGNSSGLIIPKPILAEVGIKVGDPVELSIEGGRLVVEPVRQPRAGWAEDAQRIAASGEDAPAMDGFGNDGDDDLAW